MTNVDFNNGKEKFMLKKVYRRGSTCGTVYPHWDINLLLAAVQYDTGGPVCVCVCVWLKVGGFLSTYMFLFYI